MKRDKIQFLLSNYKIILVYFMVGLSDFIILDLGQKLRLSLKLIALVSSIDLGLILLQNKGLWYRKKSDDILSSSDLSYLVSILLVFLSAYNFKIDFENTLGILIIAFIINTYLNFKEEFKISE